MILLQVPVYFRGGHIIPRKDRPRRSSVLMHSDPYTLYVALDKDVSANVFTICMHLLQEKFSFFRLRYCQNVSKLMLHRRKQMASVKVFTFSSNAIVSGAISGLYGGAQS